MVKEWINEEEIEKTENLSESSSGSESEDVEDLACELAKLEVPQLVKLKDNGSYLNELDER